MQLAKIIGYADSITKSDDLYGAELLVAVPIDIGTMNEAGVAFLLADKLGAKAGQVVVYAAANPNGQAGATLETVVAIPEALNIDGAERFRQLSGVQEETQATEEVQDEAAEGAKRQGDGLDGFDPVSDLTAEFIALHRELDDLSHEEGEFKSTTNAVPYEEYAKYLTTDFEPVEDAGGERQGYSRVGYRSGKDR